MNPYVRSHFFLLEAMFIDLNVRTKKIKLLEENTGVNLYDLGLGKAVLVMTPKAEAAKEKIYINWTELNLKCLSFKDTIK